MAMQRGALWCAMMHFLRPLQVDLDTPLLSCAGAMAHNVACILF